jgi:hypothetical protein
MEPGEFAWLVQHVIEALALSCVPCWSRWNLPPLYESGVRFALPESHGSGAEVFYFPPDTYREGKGDCDRLTIWRMAELLAQGVPVHCRARWIGDDLHVTVVFPDGQEEDPSKVLGA